MPKLTDILCFGLTFVIFCLSHRPLSACSCIERRSTTQEGWGAYAIPSDGQKNVPCNPLFILRSSRLWGWSIATASSSHATEKYNSVIELRSGQTMVPLRQSTSFAENDTTSFFRAVQQLQPRSRYQLVLTLRSFDAPTKSRTKSLSFWTGTCKKIRPKKAPLAQLYSGKIFVGESIPPGPSCGTGHAFVSLRLHSARKTRFRSVIHAIYVTKTNKASEWNKLPPLKLNFKKPSTVSPVQDQRSDTVQEKWPVAYISGSQELGFGRRSYCDDRSSADALPSGQHLRFVIESIDIEGNRSKPRLSRSFWVPQRFR